LEAIEKNLDSIIKRSYGLFSIYKVKKIQDSCTYCCIDNEEEGALLRTTKSCITPELLSLYNDAAFSNSHLNVNEFKYFLPRYMDITWIQEILNLHHILLNYHYRD
jgi:hypothetical protein